MIEVLLCTPVGNVRDGIREMPLPEPKGILEVTLPEVFAGSDSAAKPELATDPKRREEDDKIGNGGTI